jgi:hypothetical protein
VVDAYFRRHLVSEQPTCTSRRDCPSVYVFRITPHKIAEGSLVGDLLGAGYDADLIQCPNFRTQTAVYAKHLSIDDGSQSEEVEDLTAGLPY